MVVNVTPIYDITESYYESLRQLDSIVHEAEMSIMVTEFAYLQENGVLMEMDERLAVVVDKVKEAIAKMVDTIMELLEKARRNIDTKVREIKATVENRKAIHSFNKDLDKICRSVVDEAEKSKREASKANDKSALNGIMDKFKKACANAADGIKAKTETIKVDIIDKNGKKVAHSTATVADA